MSSDVLRKKSGIYSISINDQNKFIGETEDVDTKRFSASKVKVTPVVKSDDTKRGEMDEKDTAALDAEEEDLEAQRARLLTGESAVPKPPTKRPGNKAMSQSKFGKAGIGWE